MKYHAATKQLTISMDSLERVSRELMWSIRHIRLGHNLDPKGYKITGPMKDPQFAEAGILDAAKELGIDLGATRPGTLDVSNCE